MSESFQTTKWNIVISAGMEPGEAQRAALSELCKTYWYPLYAFVRRRGYSEPDAQDLTQGFFQQLLEREDLRSVSPERGRFRSFLLAALKNYLSNEQRRNSAQKRGGGKSPVSIDDSNWELRYQRESATEETPESLYHRNFANALVEKVFSELAAEYGKAGKGLLFDELSTSMTCDRRDTETGKHAEKLGISRGAVSTALHRMRARYGELLRREVAMTLVLRDDESAVESELQALLQALYP